MKYKLNTKYKKLLADTFTPVSVYLKLRDKFPNSILLESSDYHGNENSFSFICCKPIATIIIENETITETFPDGTTTVTNLTSNLKPQTVPNVIKNFFSKFDINQSDLKEANLVSGLISPARAGFGYISYDAVRYFEDIKITAKKKDSKQIPDIIYSIYQYIIAINHFKDEVYLLEHTYDGAPSTLDQIESFIRNKNFASYKFKASGNEESNFRDEEYIQVVKKGKEHCHRGDVFQIVLSREFSQDFTGDDFNVYRALRSINPSPYLYYFDYGSFKIFGSSPEAQLTVKKGVAGIHPIAGTFRRTGDDAADAALAEKLKNDAKENAEHVMLVDLARNDLSRDCHDVKVEIFREVQYYSHVIHLVSNVTGKLNNKDVTLKIVADTFPAGTLSGAPKHNAMQLIDRYENGSRGYYGGCIGYLSFDGDFNHAIMIRSFLSKNNKLFYQAGAGIVESSVEVSELNEVNNKLAALKSALKMAEQI
jgi:anthranilate synthase component 1